MAQTNRKKKRRRVQPRFYVIISVFALLILVLIGLGVYGVVTWIDLKNREEAEQIAQSERRSEYDQMVEEWHRQEDVVSGVTPSPAGSTDPNVGEDIIGSVTPGPTQTPPISWEEYNNGATFPPPPTPTPTPRPTPYMVAESNPEQYGFVPHLEVNGEEIDAKEYTREEEITFPEPDAYNAQEVKGILTFRGNNWRNASSVGTVNLTENKLTKIWDVKIGALKKGSGSGTWSGCGWTGQPLIVQWPAETRKIMNLYDWAKEKDNLVEVIYPTEDGNIYFLDLETGKKTRDTLIMQVPFKGTGSIDPRGYPLLYCGSGDEYENDSQKSRAFIISLINGRVLYEFGKQGTDPFAKRSWYAYDSAPLIDAETDTLIYPGENGVIYTMKLNTVYDPVLGSITVDPGNVVKFRYDARTSYEKIDVADSTHKWLGYEGSAAAWNGHLYLASNDGLFQCVDLNTMQVVWIANTEDDTNGSPVLDVISENEAYLYVGTSLHFNKDKNNKGIAPFFKIDAMTGKIVGRYGLTVYTVSGVSGGIQSTAAVGRSGSNISDLVFITIARYGDKDAGILVALDKETFEERWKLDMDAYSWSSPTVVYGTDGTGYVIQADSKGYISLIDGASGKVLNTIRPTDSNFEASPAVFGDKVIVGCRGDQTIFCFRLS